jgi:hypothetical protein
MAEFGDGSAVVISDKEAWSGINPPRGGIVEIDLAGTNLPVFEETWAAFFIREVEYNVDGSIYLNVQFMCAENPEAAAGLEAHVGGHLGYLHLCSSQPCVEMPGESRGAGVIHVTSLRTWTTDNFQADYVSEEIYKELKKWIAGVKKSAAAAKRAPRKGALRETKPPRAGPASGTKETKDRKKTAAGEVRDGRKKDTKKKEDDAELNAEKREKLRERLKEVRKRHHEVGEDGPLPEVVGSGSEESGRDGAEDDSSGYAPSEILTTGANMREVAKENHGRRSKAPIEKAETIVPFRGSNAGSMKTLSGQLAQQALALNRARHSDKKRKKKKEGALQTLQDALRGVLGQDKGDKKKKKKKGKKKGKKRRIEGGVIRSSSNSSESTSGDQEAEEESSPSDLEAPMKKKSREKPGSILALLIEHVKAQMEQDAALEIPDDQKKITSGVKVVSYFHQHIKSAYASHQKELREMYTLAAAVDLLRRGDVARVGDALSARFIAIHQSLLDQNWGAARHMELFPLEDAAAATSSMVLATRKHSKLVDRVQGKGTSTWTSWGGKGRGKGKGEWSYGGESTGKGKKGKTDGKGRGKGKGWQNHERATSDWSKNQEKPDPPK